jgi:hypothetical protein
MQPAHSHPAMTSLVILMDETCIILMDETSIILMDKTCINPYLLLLLIKLKYENTLLGNFVT